MVQTIEQGDIFGKIGKGIGQGVSEQAERSMLAKGIEKIAGNKDLSEVQRYGQLLRLPGGAEHANTLIPAIQRSQAIQESLGTQPSKNVATPISLSQQEEISQPKPISKISTRKDFQPLQGTTEALDSRRNELLQTQPNLYRTPEAALERATKEYATQQNILAKADKEFNDAIETRLQKKGNDVYRDVIGDMKQDYLREVQALSATGKMSPEKAADVVSSELLDFAKTRTNLKTATIPSLFGFTASGKDAQAKLNAIRNEYSDRDRLELFADDLVSKTGLSTGVADYLAFPVKSNPQINDYAKDTKKRISLNPFQGNFVSGIKEKVSKGTKKRSEQDIGNFISKNLKDTDSLNSIATSFNAKGYDPQLILNEIQKNWNSGKLRLNKRQERDLQKRGTFRATLKDIAYFSGTGLNVEDISP